MKIKENATIKRWKRMTWAREKISIASRRQFHMQNPTGFDYYQRGLHVRKSKGRISKPRGYLHRCIQSLSLTTYNYATRNASQLLNSIQTLSPCILFPRDDVDQTPTSPLDRYSWGLKKKKEIKKRKRNKKKRKRNKKKGKEINTSLTKWSKRKRVFELNH